MELRPEIVNQVMKFSTKEVEFLGSIIEQGEYSGVSTQPSVIDDVPTARELFGSQFGGTNETNVFKFIAPNVAWGSSSPEGRYVGNGKLLSIYPVENAIPADVLGPNGEITTQTTSWAIDKVKNGEMSAKEAVTIIRQRTDTLSSETRYFTPNLIDTTNPPTVEDLDQELDTNTDRKPFDTPYNVNDVKFNKGILEVVVEGMFGITTPDQEIRESLDTSIATNIVMRYRAERTIETFYDWGIEVEENISNGTYKEEFVNGDRIIYIPIENEYRATTPETKTGKRISHPDSNKELVLPPVAYDLQEEYHTESEISATGEYIAYCQSGQDVEGNSTPTDSSQQLESAVAGQPNDETIDYGKDRQSDVDVSPNKGILYGVKSYPYGILTGTGMVFLAAAKIPNLSGGAVRLFKFLANDLAEGSLTLFKVAKDLESQDGGRFVRDIIGYWLGHVIAHPAKESAFQLAIQSIAKRFAVTVAGELGLSFIPYAGWIIAIGNIGYDLAIQPGYKIIKGEKERYDAYVEAITVNEREREDGTTEAWCLDPGLALYGVKVERPVLGPGITTRIVEAGGIDDGLGESIQSEPPNVISTSPIIGVKKDPVTGKAAVDSNQNIVPIYDEDGVKPGLDTTQPKIIIGEEISDYRLSEPRIQQKIKSSHIKDQVAKQESIILISRAEYVPVDMGDYDVNPVRQEQEEDPSIDEITPPEWDITYEDSIWIDNWYNSLSSDVLSNPVLPGNRTKLFSYPYISSQTNINANGEPQTPSFYGNETFTIPSL